MKKSIQILLLIILSSSGYCLNFNQSKIINKASKGEELKADEGYLFLSFETKFPIPKLTIKSDKIGNNIVFRKTKVGQNYALIKLKAGNYYWHSIKYDSYSNSRKFKKDFYPIKIIPGVVNYPGSWEFQLNDYVFKRIYFHLYLTNKSSIEINEFKRRFSDISRKYKMSYQAQFKDPYIEFHQESFPKLSNSEIVNRFNTLSGSDTSANHQIFNPSDGVVTETKKHPQILNYLKADDHSIKSMNPSGNLVIANMEIGNNYIIAILNLKTLKSYTILNQELPEDSFVSSIKWIDNDSIN